MRSFGVRAVGVVSCALAVAAGFAPTRAAACGGCFGPTGSPTVVTRHQMAVALGATQTTLWDQIEYAGEPEDFVWVLPVRGGVGVELADNAFFEALEQGTQLRFTAPPLRSFCPDPCGGAFASPSAAERDSSADAGASGVTVYHQATIGPYETVTIGSEDPDALVSWLRANGYAVPDAILPTIRHYTDLDMNFAVLRLRPTAGVNQMQPVRVTMPGLNPTFPLRMVAAGVEGKVGLELYVFAEGRYEAQNFANAEVDRSRLSYDWAAARFNYDDLYAEAAETAEGRVWITEYAGVVPPSVEYYQSYDDDGTIHNARPDYEVAVRGIRNPSLTRMTADLPANYLDQDLVLVASLEDGDLSQTFIQVQNETNRPPEPTCNNVCTDPTTGSVGGGGVAWTGGGRGDGLCSISAGRDASIVGGLGVMFAAVVLGLRRRRR